MALRDSKHSEWLDVLKLAKSLKTTTGVLCELARKGEFPPILPLGGRRKRVRKDLFEKWVERVQINPENERRVAQGLDFEDWLVTPENDERGRPHRAIAK